MIFFFNDTATTEIYTLSLHDALPISKVFSLNANEEGHQYKESTVIKYKKVYADNLNVRNGPGLDYKDRKSTRLNSSHANISYAVFCLKKIQHHNANELLQAATRLDSV